MATEAQILEVRIMINEPVNAEPWTDEKIGALIDAKSGDVNAVAYQVWAGKAARVAHLVDISEGGSSRKMSDMYKNFLAIRDTFAPEEGTTPGTIRASRTREITRS